MRSRLLAVAAVLAATGTAALVACAGDSPTMPATPSADAPLAVPARSDSARREQLAQQMAMALADPALRADLKARLSGSPIREHKVQFQRYVAASRLAIRSLAGAARAGEEQVAAAVHAAPALELYFPVPGDLDRWDGGTGVLVATIGADAESPVAFDLAGRRRVLDRTTPPNVPVLAVVPQETDFDAPASRTDFVSDGGELDAAGGSTGGGASGPPVAQLRAPGLYLTGARYLADFEGWLKGAPEFDIHILGRAGQSDSLTSLQCSGRTAPAPYTYVQTTREWSGSALLFTNAELDAYKAAAPGQGVRVVVVEDDDGPCQLKLHADRAAAAIAAVEQAYPLLSGGLDVRISTIARTFRQAKAATKVLRAVAGFFLTNDDYVGNAVERAVTGESAPFGNWIVKGENNVTNGYLQLEMR